MTALRNFWHWLRNEVPPPRLVAFLTPLVLPVVAYFNGWLADHLPFIAEQIDSTEVTAVVLGTLAAGIALAYKWLDGRAKWETAQVDGQVALATAGLDPTGVPGIESPAPSDLDDELIDEKWDEDLAMSLPSDIDESDAVLDPEETDGGTQPRNP